MAASRKLLNTHFAMQYWRIPSWDHGKENPVDLMPLGGSPGFLESSTHIFQPRGWSSASTCQECGQPVHAEARILYCGHVSHFWTLYAVEWQAEKGDQS